MILMMALMVLFWGAIIVGIVRLVRGATRGGSSQPEGFVTRESPVDILERRFAEGALSPEDYQARREVLLNGRAESHGAGTGERLTAPQAVARQ